MKICSICGVKYLGYGNNAWPINPGRCCDACNDVVVTHRIRNLQRGLSPYETPEWVEEFLSESDWVPSANQSNQPTNQH